MADSNEAEVSSTATHAERLSLVIDDARARRARIGVALRVAFEPYIEVRQTEWILFKNVTADALSAIFLTNPDVLKPITAACNIAGRAIRRDLGFEVDTYKPRLTKSQADQLAGYLRPFLPDALAIPAVEAIDEWFFVDKELRKTRGHWEKLITDELTRRSGKLFRKRKFAIADSNGRPMEFELDAAHSAASSPILVGIDVKGISHPRDFHKRGDEIVNKAEKFKTVYPTGKFGAVLHYPFMDSRDNVLQRLRNPAIDGIVFAGDSKESIELAVLALLPQLNIPVVDPTPTVSLFDDIGGT